MAYLCHIINMAIGGLEKREPAEVGDIFSSLYSHYQRNFVEVFIVRFDHLDATNKSDKVPIRDFLYGWRFTDPKWDKLPEDILSKIQPLSPQQSELIERAGTALRFHGPYVAKTDAYNIVSQTSLVENTEQDSITIGNWFDALSGNETRKEVYVSWVSTVTPAAVIAPWKIFVQYWNSFFYPFDVVNVFDDSLNWAVLLGQEEYAVYVERRSDRFSEL